MNNDPSELNDRKFHGTMGAIGAEILETLIAKLARLIAGLCLKLLPRRAAASHRSFFRFIELISHLLPVKTRVECFEPAYNDEKADYLKARLRYRSKAARRWLAFCFGLHVVVMLAQCVWGMCSEAVKKVLVSFLPAPIRRFFG